VLGIVGLYISQHDRDKVSYEKGGIKLTQIFNQLKSLYFEVKSKKGDDFDAEVAKLEELEGQYFTAAITKQVLFSDWNAHYKFFWQHQIDWVDEQKKFRFFRDKIPLSFYITVIILPLLSVIIFCLGVVGVSSREYACPWNVNSHS
jgi:hypothetical protein